MARYKSKRNYSSRLEKQQNKRLKRQTALIIFFTVALVVLLIFVGIPMLIRMAIFVGDLRQGTDAIEQSDTIPPQTPQLTSLPEATNSAELIINGFTEPGATVSLYQNNQEAAKTLVDASGKFEFSDVSLNEGNNTFYTLARDTANNESQRSVTREVTYDTQPPSLTIESPENNALIVGATRQRTEITGSTDPGTRLLLNDRVVVVRSDGSFTADFELQEGDNQLTFTAIDKAGNQTEEQLTLKYSRQ